MDDMLGLLFFPRMNWMACKQHFLVILKGTVHGREAMKSVCIGYGTVSHSLLQYCGFGSASGSVSISTKCFVKLNQTFFLTILLHCPKYSNLYDTYVAD
jgi:hypothetical protein